MNSLNYLMSVTQLLMLIGVKATSISLPNNTLINNITRINHQLIDQNNAALLMLTSLSPLSSSSMSAPSTNAVRMRKRHHKRHSVWIDYSNYNENSTILEWSNPCGGVYHPNANQHKRPTTKEQKKIYNTLRKSAFNDFNYLNCSHQQDIDISNIEIWWLHNATYKFLPKLKMNSSIALKRWYRNMQTYVASFAYLHRIQFMYDRSKSQRESSTAQEIKELLKSSQNMLCELETAVNKTTPAIKRQMPQVTRLQMNKRLKLRTKLRFQDNANALAETDSIDLKFVKFYYFEYLKSMWQLLKNFNRRTLQTLWPNGQQTSQPQQQQQSSGKQFAELDKPLNKNHMKRNKKRKHLKTKHKLV